MNNFKNIVWGILLIILGVILGGNALGFIDVTIFFKGWWTLFIIIPSFVGIINDKDKTGSIIFFLIGIALLLSSRDIIDSEIVWKLMLPGIIIVLGLSMIFKGTTNKSLNNDIKELNKKLNPNEACTAIFSGQEFNIDGEEFKGTSLNAIFGGIELDIRKAVIENDVIINVSSIFGGIDIFVPDGYKIKIKSNSIFGGISNEKKNNVEDNAHTIFINATCVFGGVEIK